MPGYTGAMRWGWLRYIWRRLVRGAAGVPDTGALGERAAAAFLQREKRFAILRRNWRHERDEIDLICRDAAVLVFVEVKTRAAHALVAGYHAVDRRKKRALLRVCRAYITQLIEKPQTFRLDVVEVEHRDGVVTAIRHFENVPLFPKGYRPGRSG